jgi:hypothetical protein
MEENKKSGLLGKAMHVGERLVEVGGEAARLKNAWRRAIVEDFTNWARSWRNRKGWKIRIARRSQRPDFLFCGTFCLTASSLVALPQVSQQVHVRFTAC